MTSAYNTGLDQFSYVGQHTHNSDYPNSFVTERSNANLFGVGYQDYKMYQEDPCTNTTGNDIVKPILEKNPISQPFFSKKNLDHLQYLVVKLVKEKSGGKYCISRQSDNELMVVMRSIYLQYGKNLPYDIPGQIAELNKQVLIDVVPRIMVKAEQHLGYIRDRGSNGIRTMPRGEYASSAGTRVTKGFSSLFI